MECLYSIGCLAQELADSAPPPGEGGPAEQDVAEMLRMQYAVAKLLTRAGRVAVGGVVARPMPAGRKARAVEAEDEQEVRREAVCEHAGLPADAQADIQAGVAATSAAQATARILERAPAAGRAALLRPGAGALLPAGLARDEEARKALAELQEAQAGSGELSEGVRGILCVAAELAGGEETMVKQLAAMAKDEICRLAAKGAASGGAGGLPGAVELGGERLKSIACLLGTMLKLVNPGALAGDLAQSLVGCILQAVELPAPLRPSVRPFVDLALSQELVHAVSSELWAQVQASCSKGCAGPMSPRWVYAAGCLALEIEEVLERVPAGEMAAGAGSDSQAAGTREVVRCLQWAAHFHLSWLGYTRPPLADAACTMSGMQEQRREPEESRERGGCADMGAAAAPTAALAGTGRPQLTSAALADSENLGSASEAEDSEVVPSTPTSEASFSTNDRASDLEDFVDMAPESNAYGLLKHILPEKVGKADGKADAKVADPEPSPGCRAAAAANDNTAFHPEVRDFFSKRQIVTDWQAHCRMLLKKHGSPPRSPREKLPTSPLPKKRRLEVS